MIFFSFSTVFHSDNSYQHSPPTPFQSPFRFFNLLTFAIKKNKYGSHYDNSAQKLYYYFSILIRVFHISVSWWFFAGVWVTASLLKSPGLFSVFWPFLIMLSFGWSPLVRQPLRPFCNPWVTVQNAPITIGIIVTFMFHSFFNFLARSSYLSFFLHSFSFFLWSAGTAKSTIFVVDYY